MGTKNSAQWTPSSKSNMSICVYSIHLESVCPLFWAENTSPKRRPKVQSKHPFASPKLGLIDVKGYFLQVMIAPNGKGASGGYWEFAFE